MLETLVETTVVTKVLQNKPADETCTGHVSKKCTRIGILYTSDQFPTMTGIRQDEPMFSDIIYNLSGGRNEEARFVEVTNYM